MQVAAMIRRAALQFGDAPCLTEGERTLSFRDFDRLTDAVGNALLARGLEPGDRVGLVLPNSIDCLVAYYGVCKAGMVRVQLNNRETLDEHRYKLAHTGARAVIHDDIDGLDAEIRIGRDALARILAEGDDTPCVVERDLDAIMRLAFTGGTTGRPKAAILSIRTELVELAGLMLELTPDLGPGDRFLHAAPIAHASGAMFLPTLARGGESVMMTKFDPAGFLRLARETGATYAFLVPTMLGMLMDLPAETADGLALKRVCYAGSSIAPALVKRAEARFGRVFAQTYGQAASPMVITCLKPEDHDRAASCGRPYPFVDVAIFDENDRPLGPGEIGEIVCRGPQLMVGYWQDPASTEEALQDGWLRTGDLGRMDEDGFYYIVDRKNDMFISGGFNIYPREVEDALAEFPGVSEVAVVGIPDETWGDRVAAVVSGPGALDADAVMRFAQEHVAGFKRPRSVHVWKELPKSGAGKILRRKVRDQLIATLS